jgi:hypothetical protein
VSLILEALKKVERERATPEQRGFLVLGPTAWAPSRSNLAWVLGMIAAAAAAGGAVYMLTRPPTSAVHAEPRPEDRVAPQGPTSSRPADRAYIPPTATDLGWTRPSDSPLPQPTGDAAAAGTGVVPERAPAVPVLTLHAISEQNGAPVAVVNERVVREGDSFDGVRILRIGAAEVEVEVAGARRTLRF